MSFQKKINDLKQFEKNISNTIFSFLAIAIFITTILFIVIYYQTQSQQSTLQSKDIQTTVNLFESNLSEKLSIIANSTIFIDFLTSGKITQQELEPRFLTELLPLRSSGIVGYTLKDTETGAIYHFGNASDKSVSLKLCYLASKLDHKNGNCSATMQLFFSKKEIDANLTAINNSIKPCANCKLYNLAKDGYFGNFSISEQHNFNTKITIAKKPDYIFYYYLTIISILTGFALFSQINLRKMIKKTITHPLNVIVTSLKDRTFLSCNLDAVDELNYLTNQIEADRIQINKIKDYEKKAEIGNLIARVAHDIISPLAVIEITISQVAKDLPPTQSNMIRQAVQNVRDIANNLLERYRQPSQQEAELIGRITKNSHSFETISLLYIVRSIISQKKQEWINSPCEVVLILKDHNESRMSCVSPNEIKRILSNLLNNAYEALLDNRKIIITLSTIDNTIKLEIQDYGKGIEANTIEYVLNGKSLKHQGEGIGLSYAKKYMTAIGGTLSLTSKLNGGTNIILTFPGAQI